MKAKHALGKALFLTVMAVALFAAASGVQAAENPDWFFHDIVDIEFVKKHVTIPPAENVMLIDARPARKKYDPGHIPMAVNIPDSSFDKMTDQLPADKGALLIFYCEGPTCKLSHKSAKKAEALGYTNVKVFADGFPGWIKEPGHYASVSEAWVKKQMDSGTDMVLVDSRPKRTKYDKGHIPGAISIPDSSFDKMTDQLPAEKDKLLVFYCGGLQCRLSHKSAEKAMALGYTNVKVFSAGFPAWKTSYGEAVAKEEKSDKAAGSKAADMLKPGKEEGSVDIAEFKNIIENKPETLYLVDVRDPDEFAAGTLKTAVNIPVDKLEDKIASLPGDKPIVFICGTGARSGESYYMVQDVRPELKNVYYVEAQMTFNQDGTYKIEAPAN